jgi:hypothetical protein
MEGVSDMQKMVADDIFMPPLECECCGIGERELAEIERKKEKRMFDTPGLRSCRIMGADCICSDCFSAWYDPARDFPDHLTREGIGRYVRDCRAQGLRP